MFASAAILWLTIDAAFGRLFVYPGYDAGTSALGGIAIEQPLTPDLSLTVAGRAGATCTSSWRPVFEGAAELAWRRTFDVHAGIRHDDRLRREGALADFRDPTGRVFIGATVLPLRKGAFAAGAAVDYERALPGTGRLPSSVSVALVGRVRVSIK